MEVSCYTKVAFLTFVLLQLTGFALGVDDHSEPAVQKDMLASDLQEFDTSGTLQEQYRNAIDAATTGAHRSLLTTPPQAILSYISPQNTGGAVNKVLDGKNGLGTQVVLNNKVDPPSGTQLFNVQSDGEIQLGTQFNGKTYCLDVAGANYANGASVLTWPCNGQTNQKWSFVAKGGNYYSISPVGNTNFCMDVRGGGTVINTQIIIFGCNGGSNQAFTFVSGG